MENRHRFPYNWNLSDGYPAKDIEKHGLKVFGAFVCGGGSSMGYKLAGYEHLGGVELDASIAEIYESNHHPKYLFVEDIREFNKRENLPPELYNLDVLDGSPPCSTFSMVGDREKAWGKEKIFAEGQKKQRLDDLVFVYIETILKLKPKAFILENVAGLVRGNAKAYVREILKRLRVEYMPQVFLLNAASMGVPQSRERIFIIGHRKDIALPPLKLNFNEAPIPYRDIEDNDCTRKIFPSDEPFFDAVPPGKSFAFVKRNWHFTHYKLHPDKPVNTIVASDGGPLYHYRLRKRLSDREMKLAGTYPQDYMCDSEKLKFIIGMSVPPVMTANIAYDIYLQWFKK